MAGCISTIKVNTLYKCDIKGEDQIGLILDELQLGKK